MPILGRLRCDPGLLVNLVLGSRSLGTPILGRPNMSVPRLIDKAYSGQQELAHIGPAEVRPKPIGKAW